MRKLLFVAVCVSLASAFAEKQEYGRYQTIVDRQMFGPLPPGFDPTKRPSEVQKSSVTERELSQEQEKLKSSIKFSAIDVRPSGEVAVGFSDNTDPKSPRIYFLKVGETRDGWTVKEADAEAATMTIAKDEVEVTLSLGGDSAKDAGATARAGAGGHGAAAASGGSSKGLLGGSLRARRLQRQQEAAAAEAEREAARQMQAEQENQRREQENQRREQERAEQRQQLQAIQEELKRVRESKAASAEKPEEPEPDADNQPQ